MASEQGLPSIARLLWGEGQDHQVSNPSFARYGVGLPTGLPTENGANLHKSSEKDSRQEKTANNGGPLEAFK